MLYDECWMLKSECWMMIEASVDTVHMHIYLRTYVACTYTEVLYSTAY